MIKKLIIFIFITPFLLIAKFSNEMPLNQPFNAEVLNQNEKMASVLGFFNYGLTENIQVSTNLFMDVASMFNFNIKLQLVETEDYLFSINYYYYNMGDDDYPDVSVKTKYMPLLLNNTFKFKINDYKSNINFGLSYLYLTQDKTYTTIDEEYNLKSHMFSMHGGVDLVFSESSAISATVFFPFKGYSRGETSYYEAEADINFIKSTSSIPVFLSYNHSFNVFNMEMGLFHFQPLKKSVKRVTVPYINLFWRF